MSIPSRPPSSPWRSAHATPHPRHDPARVLVAEDDPEMRHLVVEALRKDGYEVTEVADGGRLLVELAHQVTTNYEQESIVKTLLSKPDKDGRSGLPMTRSDLYR